VQHLRNLPGRQPVKKYAMGSWGGSGVWY